MKIIRNAMFLIFLLTAIYGSAKVELYVMSQNEYGVYAENVIYMIMQRVPDIEVDVYYLLDWDEELNEVWTVRGKPELEENKRQIVIREYFPKAFWNYLMSRNTHYSDSFWQKDAAIAGLNIGIIDSLTTLHGDDLLLEDFKRCDSLGYSQSPTIIVDGIKLRNWDGQYASIFTALNSRSDRYNLPQCFGDMDCIPKSADHVAKCIEYKCEEFMPAEVPMTVISYEDGDKESLDYMINFFNNYIVGLKPEVLDYEEDKAQRLIEKLEIETLPAYVFGDEIKESEMFEQIQNRLVSNQTDTELYYMANPKMIETELFLNREIQEDKLTIFVMSECPYGNMAIDDFYEAAIKKDNDIELGYIFEKDTATNKITSMHGELEVIENIRQMVIQEFYPQNMFWDYLKCRNSIPDHGLNNPGQLDSCAISVGIAKTELDSLIALHGNSLMEFNYAVCDSYGITASPTFLWENQKIITRDRALEKFEINEKD